MGRQIVKINKYADQTDRNFIPLKTNNFDAVLYTNMYTPSEANVSNRNFLKIILKLNG